MNTSQNRSTPNTNCSPSCKEDGRTRRVEIFGKTLIVKGQICSSDGIYYRPKEDPLQLELSISPTAFCPAACPFCVAGQPKGPEKLDPARLETALRKLKEIDFVRGIKITGGEPFCDVVLLDEVICLIFEIFGFSLEVSISTNGCHLPQMHRLRYLSHLESIHISRHHYDDARNRALFGGGPMPDGRELQEAMATVSYPDLFVFNCMLLRDGINSPEEAHRFLDFAIDAGVPKVAFMTCMPCNDYAREQSIPYEGVIRRDDPSLLFTRHFYDREACHCSDGIYLSPDGRLIEFYGRSTAQKYPCCRGLSYETDNHLRAGFGGEILL